MNNLIEGRLLRWWESMFLSLSALQEKDIIPAPTLYKAELKRCQDIDAVVLTEGFRALWFSLPEDMTAKHKQENMVLWAMIAMTLVYVKTDTTANLATAAGTKTDNDKPIVSPHRFAQLQSARTPEELVTRLRRILQQLKGQVSVLSLARDIEQWLKEHHQPKSRRANKRLIVQWAMDYHKAAN